MSDNHFIQLAHRTQRLQHIANELNSKIKVESVIVFIDEHCEVSIESEISTKVIQRHQLKFYIESITKADHQGDRVPSINQIAEHIGKYQITSPFRPKLLSNARQYNELRKGINCAKCQSFNISIAYQSTRCHDCGHREYKKLVVSK